jgi:hypothetical protein
MILIGFQNIIFLKVNFRFSKKYLFRIDVSLGRSPKKSPSSRKSRQTTGDTSGTGAASSENDE